jgi:hypothetical protein
MNPHTGRLLWNELHAYAWHYPEYPTAEDQRLAREWLADYTRRVGEASAGKCPCRRHWEKLLRRCAPSLDSRAAFYWWTVAAHDAINRRLSKPLHAPQWSPTHPLLARRR